MTEPSDDATDPSEPIDLSGEELAEAQDAIEARAAASKAVEEAAISAATEHITNPPVGDSLPEDLDLNVALVGPYTFPDVKRRRIAGYLYLVLAVLCVGAFFLWDQRGFVYAAIALAVIAAYQFLCAWPLKVDQTEALAVAARTVGFPIGHSSAQLAWRGLRSRPSWRVLIYSADEPPSIRGLVELDGVNGEVLGEYTEHNPEDWSKFGLA